MSDHLSRKELRTDQAAVAVGHTVDYFAAHRKQAVQIGAAVLVVLALAAGIYYYRNAQSAAREQLLGEAFATQSAPVGTAPPGGGLNFPSESAKQEATARAFGTVYGQYGGTDEGYIAEYYLAGMDVDSGKMDSAKKRYQDVADNANKNYASLAKLALAQVSFAENRLADGEKLLKGLIDNPTDLVSKDQATIALARAIGKTRPAEAKKLLDPLAGKQSEISPIAIQALAEVQGK